MVVWSVVEWLVVVNVGGVIFSEDEESPEQLGEEVDRGEVDANSWDCSQKGLWSFMLPLATMLPQQ